MKSPIALYLTEFRTDPTPAFGPEADDVAAFELGDLGLMPSPLSEGLLQLPAPDPDAEAASAANDGPPVDDAPAAALSDIVATLEADHAAALAEARQRWVTSEGDALARHVSDALHALEERLAATLAPMLEPFLVRAAQLKALDALRDAIRTLLAGEARETIRVTGPADLLAALEAAHHGEPRLAFGLADTPDVTVAVADTVIRSRLQAWASTLEASLGDAA